MTHAILDTVAQVLARLTNNIFIMINGQPGMGMVTQARRSLPEAPVFMLSEVQYISHVVDFHKFLRDNADKTVILDAAKFFDPYLELDYKRQSRFSVEEALLNIVNHGEIPQFLTLDPKPFTGNIVLCVHGARGLSRPTLNRFAHINLSVEEIE